jgi:glycosyltransferase involved in cell wall biosynthesis
MVAQTPVVATAVGGTPDVLNDGEFGRLVPSRDVDQLVQAILETLENVDPDTLTKAQTYALNSYDISRLVNDLATLYQDLLVAKGKR